VGSSRRESGIRIRRALLAAHDTAAFQPLALGLANRGVEIWATAGTQRRLGDAGIPARSTEEITGIQGWFGGRVKTLHPRLMGGVLAPRDESGEAEIRQREILPFDLVAIGLYPFEEVVARGASFEEGIEQIDIGGVTLLRAAAKNHRYVVPVWDPPDGTRVLQEMETSGGFVSAETSRRLAARAFERTVTYDVAISQWLRGGETRTPDPLPEALYLTARSEPLRYGENPHQRAEVLTLTSPPASAFAPWPLGLRKGDPLSYNNLLDLDRGLALAGEFSGPTAVVLKHATPCGVASAPTLEEALQQALETDPVARFGCALVVNTPFPEPAADVLKGIFVDLLAAPGFGPGALERLSRRARVKVVEARPVPFGAPRWELRSAAGRVLLQEADRRPLRPTELRQVTRAGASPEQIASLDFAWRVVRHARSNAIVLAQGQRTVGIGSGQTSRVGAVQEALRVAGDRARGSVLASDAFFPFPDGLEAAASAGVCAVLQPGGSIRDAEIIEAADRAGLAMYFCGWRAFRH